MRFKKGYKINEQDILENVYAVLVGAAQSWYQVNRKNWYNLEEFIREFKQVYLNERYPKIIHNNIKFCKQKKNQGIHNFRTEMKQLF